MDQEGPRVPPPWIVSREPSEHGPFPGGERRAAGPADRIGLLSIDEDAAICLEIWDGGLPLPEALAKHGLDELRFREHRRLCDKELREEAEQGGSVKALAVHAAREKARQKRSTAREPALDLEAYAAVRAALLGAADEPAVLAARGIDLAKWEQDHRHYRERLRKDQALAERFRALFAAARKAIP